MAAGRPESMLGFAILRSSNVCIGSAPALGWAPPQLSCAGACAAATPAAWESGRIGKSATEPRGAFRKLLICAHVVRLDWTAGGKLELAGGDGMAAEAQRVDSGVSVG